MPSPISNIELRSKVWTALAELFVARELQDYDYQSIAATLKASRLGPDELLHILRVEVSPAFMANLSVFNPVPAMECWSESEVREKIFALRHTPQKFVQRLLHPLRRDPLRHPVLRARWHTVQQILNA